MTKVSIFYPAGPAVKFDMGYYLQKHIPMVKKLLGPSAKTVSVEQGVAGGAPGAPVTYTTIAHMTFDSIEALQAAFGPHATRIMADVPNYSNVEPIVQISEIKL